jgi:hypothetical protein
MIARDSPGAAAGCGAGFASECCSGAGATFLAGAVTSAFRASGTDAGAGSELVDTANRGARTVSCSEGAFIQTTTATTETVATGTSQRTVDVCHHFRSGGGAAVLAIAASIA